jgi:HSP20 family molecular chaperone IbpA
MIQKEKYHRVVDLPPEADIETARSNYNNGILEITFNKRSPYIHTKIALQRISINFSAFCLNYKKYLKVLFR